MPTLSFHTNPLAERKIRAAARKRGIPVSRFLREAVEIAAGEGSPTDLGAALEKVAIDSMAQVSLEKIRERAKMERLDQLSEADILAEIKAVRRERRKQR